MTMLTGLERAAFEARQRAAVDLGEMLLGELRCTRFRPLCSAKAFALWRPDEDFAAHTVSCPKCKSTMRLHTSNRTEVELSTESKIIRARRLVLGKDGVILERGNWLYLPLDGLGTRVPADVMGQFGNNS